MPNVGCLSRLHRESQLSEHLDGAGLPALEVTGGKPLTGGEFVAVPRIAFGG